MKTIVLASSKGIGKSVADAFEHFSDVVRTDSRDINTSDINSVRDFVNLHCSEPKLYPDVLVLNTGGPPAKSFWNIEEDEWHKYYYQLFYSFVYLLKNMKIKKDGYIFLISSHQIKEPDSNMALSVTFRSATSSLLKLLSNEFAKDNISCINIAPGPIETERLKNLVEDIEGLKKILPLGRIGKPDELGRFIASIVENKIKYLTGVTINFDGGLNKFVY